MTPFFTLVGMYTNVPEGGSIDSIQQQWLANEFAEAPADKALIVALHHPIYSFDDHHSGSSRMADAIQNAINDTRRVPSLVLTGHVHNYQRIEKTISGRSATPFIVVGGGGYHNLHHFNTDVHPDSGRTTDPKTGATLVAGVDDQWSYLTLTVDAREIRGAVTCVDRSGKVTKGKDSFSYPAVTAALPAGSHGGVVVTWVSNRLEPDWGFHGVSQECAFVTRLTDKNVAGSGRLGLHYCMSLPRQIRTSAMPPGPDDSLRSQSTADESFFDLLEETLGSLDRGVRGQFLAQFFKALAHIELSDGESSSVWDRVLARRKELSMSRAARCP